MGAAIAAGGASEASGLVCGAMVTVRINTGVELVGRVRAVRAVSCGAGDPRAGNVRSVTASSAMSSGFMSSMGSTIVTVRVDTGVELVGNIRVVRAVVFGPGNVRCAIPTNTASTRVGCA